MCLFPGKSGYFLSDINETNLAYMNTTEVAITVSFPLSICYVLLVSFTCFLARSTH